MKLMIAIVSNDDSGKLLKALVKERYSVTKLSTTGGFLNAGNTTLLIGCQDEQIEKITEVISANAKTRTKIVPNSIMSEFGMFSTNPIEVQVGGANIFVVDVEKFIKL